jgi:bacterioferritin
VLRFKPALPLDPGTGRKKSRESDVMLGRGLTWQSPVQTRYRTRVRQSEALGEYAMAEHSRPILIEEQDHLISLATALGIDPPAMNG